MTRQRETRLYVQLGRKIPDWRNGVRSDMRTVSVTNAPPTNREPGSIVVALELRVPDEAFDERRISAVVDVPLEACSDIEPDVGVVVGGG